LFFGEIVTPVVSATIVLYLEGEVSVIVSVIIFICRDEDEVACHDICNINDITGLNGHTI
jgi:hypothetical protein